MLTRRKFLAAAAATGVVGLAACAAEDGDGEPAASVTQDEAVGDTEKGAEAIGLGTQSYDLVDLDA